MNICTLSTTHHHPPPLHNKHFIMILYTRFTQRRVNKNYYGLIWKCFENVLKIEKLSANRSTFHHIGKKKKTPFPGGGRLYLKTLLSQNVHVGSVAHTFLVSAYEISRKKKMCVICIWIFGFYWWLCHFHRKVAHVCKYRPKHSYVTRINIENFQL